MKVCDPCYLGFDIGGTKCATVIATAPSAGEGGPRFMERDEFPTCGRSWRGILELATSLFQSYIVKYEVEPRALGISCGGPLDSARGLIQSPPNLPGWDDVPILEVFGRDLGIPCFLENDANAGAIAERRYGAGVGLDNLIFLTFGTGMGAGLILNGELFRGASGMAGEVGHIRLEKDGPQGYFKRGSFEGFCSGGGIARLGAMMLASYDGSSALRFHKTLSAKIIGEEADKGDRLSLEIYRNVGRHLGRGLAILVDSFNPDMIIIGGIYPKSLHLMKEEMETELSKEALPHSLSACRIVPSKLRDRIGDYAAIAIAAQGG